MPDEDIDIIGTLGVNHPGGGQRRKVSGKAEMLGEGEQRMTRSSRSKAGKRVHSEGKPDKRK